MDGYPLVEPAPSAAADRSDRAASASAPPDPHRSSKGPAETPRQRLNRGGVARSLLLLGLLAAHAWLCLACQGGWSQVESPWPIAWHDHPMHFHNAVVTRSFLAQNGTTAGYDPYFMAGYAKSIVSDPSGTLIEVVVAAFGRDRPAMAYKLLVLAIMALLPVLIAAAIGLVGGDLDAVLVGTTAFLIYLWTDFPLEYAGFGMIAFLLVIPMGLVVLALLVRYLRGGGFVGWLIAAAGSSLLVLVHPLSLQTVGPAVAVAYVAAVVRARKTGVRVPIARHLGLFLIPVVVLAVNAFWWLPGVVLAETRDPDGAHFFSHPEPVLSRIAQIFGLADPAQPPIQAALLGGAAVGLAALRRRCPLQAIGLGVFLASGFFWGYVAGWFPALDFLQPGRNTYAVYSAGAVATGLGWSSLRRQLSRSSTRLDRWLAPAALIVGIRLFLPATLSTIGYRTGLDPIPRIALKPGATPEVRLLTPTGTTPYLSSRPTPELAWLVDRVRETFEPGDRIYYEEGGVSRDGLPDPFGGRRYGGLLPSLARVEVIGGPFLHVPVRTNFTQFGMGRLFGVAEWGRAEFERSARLYGPSGIVCWSPRSRSFCRENPDLVEVVAEREPWLIARIRGFEGDAIRGEARVRAVAGRLEVEPVAADVDGMIVLRYHSVPGLRSDPPGLLVEVEEPGDPVPFIGVLRADGALTIEWDAPP